MPTFILIKPLRRLLAKIINATRWCQDLYERTGCRHFPADSIHYVLRVKK
jgi:hypothetical protein